MALVLKDRVKETSTTTGTGSFTLAGAVDGFQSFTSALADGDTTYYVIEDGTDWETGLGTWTESGAVLARTTVYESSNSGSAVDWGAGTKDVFITLPASRVITESGAASAGSSSSGAPNSLTFDLSSGTHFTGTVVPNSNQQTTDILFSNIPAVGDFTFTLKGESVVTGAYNVANIDTMIGQPKNSNDELSPEPALAYGVEISPDATRLVIMNRSLGINEYVMNNSPAYGGYFSIASGSEVIDETDYGSPNNEGDIRWTDSGSSLILVTHDGVLKRFKCSTPYNLSTYDANDIDSYDLTANSNITFTFILGLEVSPDGTKFFFADRTLGKIYTFTASTAYDITTLGSTPTHTFTPTNIDLRGIGFNNDGTALYQTKADEYLETIFLNTAYDLSSVSSTTSNSLSFDAVTPVGGDYSDSWPSSIRWALDGKLAVHVTDGDDNVFLMWIPDSAINTTLPLTSFSADILNGPLVGPAVNDYVTFTLTASNISGANKLFHNNNPARAFGLSMIYGD